MGYEQFRGRMIAPQTCAEALDNSEFTIHRWIRAKRIPVQRVGRQWRFKVSQVDEWVQAGEAGTGRDVRNGKKAE